MSVFSSYIYVVEATGMGIGKVGSTNNPELRFRQIVCNSAVPVSIRRLLGMRDPITARAFERDVLSWSFASAAHGEWRTNLDLVDDLLDSVSPAVDVTSEFRLSGAVEAKPRTRLTFEEIERLQGLPFVQSTPSITEPSGKAA